MAIYALIFLGSGLGGVVRFLLINISYALLGTGFPYGTIIVNVIGSFLMGIGFELIFEHFMAYSSHLKSFILIGFLGGFTTFSAFSLDTYEFIRDGDFKKAGLYILAQFILSIIGIVCGIKLVKLGA